MTTVARVENIPLSEQFGYGRGWLVRALPAVMQEDDLLKRFVTIFEEISSSVRFAVESTTDLADAAVTPAPMLRYLGGWAQAPGLHADLDVALQRRIVRAAGSTLSERGTGSALVKLLETITRGAVTVHDSGGVFADSCAPIGPPSVVVQLAGTGHLNEADIKKIVRAEVAAHVTIDVIIGSGEVDPNPTIPVEVPT